MQAWKSNRGLTVHYLDRSGIEAPECLRDYDYQSQNWKDLVSPCKQRLRHQLVEMQGDPKVSTADGAEEYGVRCAYCEGPIHHDGHIEHFRRKNKKHFPHLTFAWENLFLVCASNNHCGHYKDRPSSDPYQPDDLVKPDEHDPEKFFFFSSSGEVRVRNGLEDADHHMAKETIRVFNLNHNALQGKRRRVVLPYVKQLEEIEEFLALAESEVDREELESELLAVISDQIENTKYDYYSATVWDFYRSKV